MEYGFDVHRYYVVTHVTIDQLYRNPLRKFIMNPESENTHREYFNSIIYEELYRVGKDIGKNFCHLILSSRVLIKLIFVFDMGIQDEHFINRMKIKNSNVIKDIRRDDDAYIKHIKKDYKEAEVIDHGYFNAFEFV